MMKMNVLLEDILRMKQVPKAEGMTKFFIPQKGSKGQRGKSFWNS